ncbi:MAG: flagellar biosynthetic protein FliO [Dorea sp.]|jgi:flagellar biosynthetic protein FliO|nr:flagellar biosynthetic protein FliO [Dorea sp.]
MLRVIGTFIVAALIIYASYLASKYIGKGLGKGVGSKYMRLIDQIALGQDRHIAIVQIGGKYLLVGVTSGQINVLSEIQDDDLFPLEPEPVDIGEKIPDFKAMMEKFGGLGKRGGRK